jgi:hypothetical protein
MIFVFIFSFVPRNRLRFVEQAEVNLERLSSTTPSTTSLDYFTNFHINIEPTTFDFASFFPPLSSKRKRQYKAINTMCCPYFSSVLSFGEVFLWFFHGACPDDYRDLKTKERTQPLLPKKVTTPIKLEYWEGCLNQTDATMREKYLKSSWDKCYIKNLLRVYLTGFTS